MRALVLAALACVVGAGCSFDLDRREPPDGGGGGAKDAFVTPTRSLLATVIRTMTVPANASVIGLDLDGDGKKDNRGAEIFTTLASLSPALDLQKAIDDDLQKGDLILLFDLLADDPRDSAARVRMFEGKDSDGDPSDNFSGSETFSKAGASAAATLDGAIRGGKLSASGTVVFPLTVGGTRRSLFLERARIEATVRPNELVDGVLGGAITTKQLDDLVLPDLADVADRRFKDPNASPSTKAALATFDTDKDGTITAGEIKGHPIVGALLRPDVDLDGDGKADALSIAYGFAAIACTIAP